MSHLTEEQLNEYVDHLLTGAKTEEVELHLFGCAICQKKVDELQQVFVALAGLPEVPFQKDLTTRVLRLVKPLPTTVTERHQPCMLPGWMTGLAWIIAVLQIPLAGLTLMYAWPILRAWLAPIEPYFSQPWQELLQWKWLSAWWNGLNASGINQSILAWSYQMQQAIENLHAQPHIPNWSSQEGMMILAALLAAWVAGNYLLFNSNRRITH